MPSNLQPESDSPAPGRKELDRIYSLCYEELKRLARSIAGPPAHAPLTPSTLVQAAWLKLAQSSREHPQSELEFRRLAAHVMRNILRDEARRQNALKRGGETVFVVFDDSLDSGCAEQFEALDAALESLALHDRRQASVVELRYFGGLTIGQIAHLLEISETTAERDWRKARAWLAAAIRKEG